MADKKVTESTTEKAPVKTGVFSVIWSGFKKAFINKTGIFLILYIAILIWCLCSVNATSDMSIEIDISEDGVKLLFSYLYMLLLQLLPILSGIGVLFTFISAKIKTKLADFYSYVIFSLALVAIVMQAIALK